MPCTCSLHACKRLKPSFLPASQVFSHNSCSCWGVQHLYVCPSLVFLFATNPDNTCVLNCIPQIVCGCECSDSRTQANVTVLSVAGRTAAGVYPHGSMVMGISPGIRPVITTSNNPGPPIKKQAISVDAASQQAQTSLTDKNDELRQT